MKPLFSTTARLCAATIALAACSSGVQSTAAPREGATAGVVRITVDGDGFTPNAIHAKKGDPLVLEFVRTTRKTCAEHVVFPDLKIDRPLPLDQPVSVSVPTATAQTITFQCQMGMYKSTIEVK